MSPFFSFIHIIVLLYIYITEVIDRIITPELNDGKIYRPSTAEVVIVPKLLEQLIEKCWAEHPSDRPDLAKIKNELKSINGGK